MTKQEQLHMVEDRINLHLKDLTKALEDLDEMVYFLRYHHNTEYYAPNGKLTDDFKKYFNVLDEMTELFKQD